MLYIYYYITYMIIILNCKTVVKPLPLCKKTSAYMGQILFFYIIYVYVRVSTVFHFQMVNPYE